MFKQKQKENIRLKEVCSTCCKPTEASSASSETESCCCPGAQPNCIEVAEQKLAPRNIEESKTPTFDLGERYEVIEVIGQGGMGTVYRAQDKELGKDFAIKVLKDELAADESAIKRFEQEANAASDLTHANMLAVYGHGKTNSGSHYIVMDLLEGESLAQILKREKTLDPSRAISIATQICDALAHAHMKGLVHRDLKPSNIMLTKSNEADDIVKVLDFGIAKLMPSNNRETQNLTQTGELFGSPSYMSPEQCFGCNVDVRSDIYSLGCMMYEMLTGKPPFLGKNPIQTVVMHLNEDALPLSNVLKPGTLPKGLESIVMRCLEKDAPQRYQSMDQLAVDLRLIASGQVPKEKRTKRKKPIDLLSPPLLAIYVGLSIFCFMLFPYSAVHSVAFLWSTVLFAYFYRWLISKPSRSKQEKWRTAFIGCLLCIIGLSFLINILEWNFPNGPFINSEPSDIEVFARTVKSYANLLASIITTLVLPTIGFGWLYSYAASHSHRLRKICRWFLAFITTALLLVPVFSRHQLALVPFNMAKELRSTNYSSHDSRDPFTKSAASHLLDLAIFMDPDPAEALYERGALRKREKQANAIDDFNKILEKQPPKESANQFWIWSDAMQQRVSILSDAGNYEQAIKNINQLLDLSSSFEKTGYRSNERWCYAMRGKCHEQLGSYPNAISDYTQAIHFGDRHAYADRARAYAKSGDYAKALSDYGVCIEISTENAKFYAARASLYTELGDKDKAMQDYRSIISTHRKHYSRDEKAATKQQAADNYYWAVAHEGLGHKDQANALFESAKQGGFSKKDADKVGIYEY